MLVPVEIFRKCHKNVGRIIGGQNSIFNVVREKGCVSILL